MGHMGLLPKKGVRMVLQKATFRRRRNLDDFGIDLFVFVYGLGTSFDDLRCLGDRRRIKRFLMAAQGGTKAG